MLRSAVVLALITGCAPPTGARDATPPEPAHAGAAHRSAATPSPATPPPATPPPATPPPATPPPPAASVSAPPRETSTGPEVAPSAPPPDPPPAAPPGPIERRVLRAVESDPTVVAMCADSARRGGPCIAYVDAPGVGTCPPRLAALHPCLWTVAVMANMGTHASRRATMLVRPDGVVVAAANLFCPPMKPADWARVERASLAGTPVDDCPPHVPEVGEAPSP